MHLRSLLAGGVAWICLVAIYTAFGLPLAEHLPWLLVVTIPISAVLTRPVLNVRSRFGFRWSEVAIGTGLAYLALGALAFVIAFALLAATGQLPWPPP